MASKNNIELIISAEVAKLEKGLKQALTGINKLEKDSKASIAGIDSAFSRLAGRAATLFAIGSMGYYANSVRKIADEYTNLEARLKLVTSSAEELDKVQQSLFLTAQRTGTEYAVNAASYAKLATSLKSVKASSDEVLAINEMVNKSLIVSGASSAEAASFTLQFGQAMGSGVLQGDEFRAMMESNSYFAQQLAQAFNTDIAGLRKMSAAGQLTTSSLREAFSKMAAEISAAFEKIPPTTERALTALDNSYKQIISDSNKASDGTGTIADEVMRLSRTIDENREGIISLFTAIISGSAEVVQAMGNIGQSFAGWKAVGDGRLGFLEFATMDAKELNTWLKENVELKKELESGQEKEHQPEQIAAAQNNYRTPDYLDQLDEAVLTPEELEDRKKRWAEREQQEKKLNDEKNTVLDDVAKANAAEDEKRAAIRAADAKRAGLNSGVTTVVSERIERHVTRENFFKDNTSADKTAPVAAEKPAPTKKVRSGSSDQILSKKEIAAQEEVASAVKVIIDEAEAYRLKSIEDQTAAAKEAADKQADAQKEGVGKMQSVFTAYAERVKKIQDEIAGRERSLADELADLDPHTTEEQRWRRKAKAAADYEKAAKSAMAAGRLDEARDYADQAKTTYAGLKDGSGNISDKLAARTAYSGVSSAGTLGLNITKMMTDAAAKAAKSSISGIDGLNNRVSAQLQKAMGNMATAAPTGPGKQAPVQVHEIRLGKAKLQGSADDVADFIKQLELAGMRA